MHNRSHFIGSLDPNAPHTVCGISVAASKKGHRAQLHPTNGVLIKCIEYMDADPASQNIPPSCPRCHAAFYAVQHAWGHGRDAFPPPSILNEGYKHRD